MQKKTVQTSWWSSWDPVTCNKRPHPFKLGYEVILRLVRPHDLNISYVGKVVVKLSSSLLIFINFFMKFKFDPKLPKVSLNCEFLTQNSGKSTQFFKYLLGRLRVISKEASKLIFIAYYYCLLEDTTLRSFPSLWVCV